MTKPWEDRNASELKFELGDGNLVPKQPADLEATVGATLPSIDPAEHKQLVKDVAAIKAKLGM